MKGAYYNENDPYAAQWLRNLIAAGHLPAGDVDERSLVKVTPDDCKGYTQCHFFAGIGGWPYALRLAGWPDDRPVWTGSCPCQPFSSAGKRARQSDERHLWPHWYGLIKECRPAIVFGEQVEKAIAAGWLDDVFHDLETADYACAAAVLPACSIGAPHRRDRIWFVADAQGRGIGRKPGDVSETHGRPVGKLPFQFDGADEGTMADAIAGQFQEARRRPVGRNGQRDDDQGSLVANAAGEGSHAGAYPGIHRGEKSAGARHGESERYRCDVALADSDQLRGQRPRAGAEIDREAESAHGHRAGGAVEDPESIGRGKGRPEPARQQRRLGFAGSGISSHVGVTFLAGLEGYAGNVESSGGGACKDGSIAAPDTDWLECPDGKIRPVKSGIRLLAHGIPARVGRLRAYGNAIVPQVAAEFIAAVMEE